MKKSKSLNTRITMALISFLVVLLGLSFLLTYISQMRAYRKECENSIRNVGVYLLDLIDNEGTEFKDYQKLYLERFPVTDIPYDASEYKTYEKEFYSALSNRYPGKTLYIDLKIEDLDDDLKDAYLRYKHLYWLLTFEDAREAFDLPYTYYLIPNESDHTVMYMIDGERSSRAGHNEFISKYPQYQKYNIDQGNEDNLLYLGDTYYNDPKDHKIEWETWKSGQRQEGFQIWHNQWGDTYSCYTPLIIDNQKLGLIVAEIEISRVNEGVLSSTLRQTGIIALVFSIGTLLLIMVINKRHISRIIKLEEYVRKYTYSKDPSISKHISGDLSGEDEIASLADGIVTMILDIKNYIDTLTQTNKQLDKAMDESARLSVLANMDSLTGVRNATSYENEIRNINNQLLKGNIRFGVAMIDMNYLKKINDRFGHDNGNIAIQKVCNTVCDTFKHSKVFRIGGDEFVAILRNKDYENHEILKKELLDKFEEFKYDETLYPWQKVSASIGIALFDQSNDKTYEDVFKRADELMYAHKKQIHAIRSDS